MGRKRAGQNTARYLRGGNRPHMGLGLRRWPGLALALNRALHEFRGKMPKSLGRKWVLRKVVAMSVRWHVRDLPWLGNRGGCRHRRPFIAERHLKGCVVVM